MLFNTIFKKKIPIPSNDLPLTLISLKNWILIKVHGADVIQYLHNQFTCDIKNLDKNQYSFAAYCNNKGKMISNMYVFSNKNQEIAFILPMNIHKQQISIMKKYAAFSNIIINPDYNTTLLGIAGGNSKKYLNIFFDTLPNQTYTIVRYPDVILLYFNSPIERFLLVIQNKLLLTNLLNKAQLFSIQYSDHHQWIALDIESGYPYISNKTTEMFFPQSANMDILQGINFKKGCYLGQELIARIQYHKLNKQSLYQLSGNLDWNKITQLPTEGDIIELEIHNQCWKNIGTILQSCTMKNNQIWIQAILNKSIETHKELRIRILKTYDNINTYINLYTIKITRTI